MERTPNRPRRRVTLRRALPRAVVATLVLAGVWTAAPPTSAPPAGADDGEPVTAAAAPTGDAATTAAPEPVAPATTTTSTVAVPEDEPVAESPLPTPPAATPGLTAAPPAVASTDPGAPSSADARNAPAPELLVTAADTLVTITPASPGSIFGTPVPDLSVVAAVDGIPAGDPQLDTLACTATGLRVRDDFVDFIDSPAGTYPLSCTVDAVEGRTVTIRPASLTITPATARVTGLGFTNLVTSVLDPTVDFNITVQTTGGRARLDRLDLALVFTPEAGPPIRVPVTASPERTFFRDVWTFRTAVELPPGRYSWAAELGGNGYWTPSSLRFGSAIEVLRLPNADITPASPTATYGAVVPDLSVVASVQGIPADDPQLDTLDCTAEGLEVRDGRIDSPAGTYPLTCTVDAVDGRTVTFRPAALTVRANTAFFLTFTAGYPCAEGNFQFGTGSMCLDSVQLSVDINRRNSPEPPGPTRIQVVAYLRPLQGGPEIAIPIDGPLRLGRQSREVLIPFSVPPGRYEYRLEVIGTGYWEPRVRINGPVFVQPLRRVALTPTSPTARTGDPVPDLSVVASVTGDAPDPGQLEALTCTADGLEVTDGRITSPPGRYPLSCQIPRGLRQDLTILPAALTVEPAATTTTTTVAPTTVPTTTAPPTTDPPITVAPATTTPAPTVEAAAATAPTTGTAAVSTTTRAAGLAFTGGDLGVLGTVAAALALAGGLLLLARRRRTD